VYAPYQRFELTDPRPSVVDMLGNAGALLLAMAILLWPSLWNGYPLLYHDTEDYVNMSFTFDVVIWRTMPYAVLVGVGRLAGTLWAVVALQAAMTVWLLHEATAAFVPRRRAPALIGAATVLSLATGLPWITSTLMPDTLTGLVPLGIATLAFGTQLPRWRRMALLLPVVIAIACHLSHLALAIGLLLALLALRLATQFRKRAMRPALGLVICAVAIGAALIPAIHKLATGQAFYTRGGRVLQLALFVQNGIAKRYLDQVCPNDAPHRLCAHRDKLPATADSFLWAPWASPFWKLGGWTGMRDEARKIVLGAVHTYPGAVALAAWNNAVRQFGEIRLGDGLGPKRHPGWGGEYHDTGKARYPQEFAAYIGARQQQGKGIDFAAINNLQVPIAWAGLVLLALLQLETVRRRDVAGTGLALVALLAILGNAILCGAISNPHDRYQNRIIWLALGVDLLLLARLAAAQAWGLVPQPAPALAVSRRQGREPVGSAQRPE
jgi:hypothetical protein